MAPAMAGGHWGETNVPPKFLITMSNISPCFPKREGMSRNETLLNSFRFAIFPARDGHDPKQPVPRDGQNATITNVYRPWDGVTGPEGVRWGYDHPRRSAAIRGYPRLSAPKKCCVDFTKCRQISLNITKTFILW